MDQYEFIDLRVQDGVATLTLDRPDKRNAFTDAMRAAFIAALERVTHDREIRALVLTGAGKGFCAGGDVAGMQQRM
ncbi:MAG: enoyl-CoA hydratase/isomerase family protein, partial [Bordetella sp.]|nr:enoyl-CoA hydratase/isomerase family protein [Bordetella sp.]